MHHIPRCIGMCEERAFSFQKHYISLKCEVTLQSLSPVLRCPESVVSWVQCSSLDGPGLSAKAGQSRIYLGLWWFPRLPVLSYDL